MQGKGLAGHALLHFDGLQEITIRRSEIWGSGEDGYAGRCCGVAGPPVLEWELKGQSEVFHQNTSLRYQQRGAFI